MRFRFGQPAIGDGRPCRALSGEGDDRRLVDTERNRRRFWSRHRQITLGAAQFKMQQLGLARAKIELDGAHRKYLVSGRITRLHGGRNHQLRQRHLLGVLPAAHQAGHLVGFQQMIHGPAQTELVSVFARAKIPRANTHPAQRFATELAGFQAYPRASL
jgi:hypothetical protein